MHTKDDILALTREDAYQDFLFNVEPADGHYIHRLTAVSNNCLDAMMLEIYHGMAFVLQEYPSIQFLRPRWTPSLGSDDGFRVSFRVEVSCQNQDGTTQLDTCGYEQYPASLKDMDKSTFALMIEFGETIDAELWQTFKDTDLASRKKPYCSVEDIEAQMMGELGEFLVSFDHWAFNHRTSAAPRASERKPGL